MSQCKSCGKHIVFLKTKNGKLIPVNMESIKPGDLYMSSEFDILKGHVSHFSDCKDAKNFRNIKK